MDKEQLKKNLWVAVRRIPLFLNESSGEERTFAAFLATKEVELFEKIIGVLPSDLKKIGESGVFNIPYINNAMSAFQDASEEDKAIFIDSIIAEGVH